MSVEELRKLIIQKAWEDEDFKTRLIQDPKKAVAETFNFIVPDDIEVNVLEESKKQYYLVIPPNPNDIDPEPTLMAPEW